jgi:hypothetical protein
LTNAFPWWDVRRTILWGMEVATEVLWRVITPEEVEGMMGLAREKVYEVTYKVREKKRRPMTVALAKESTSEKTVNENENNRG